jgi:hypothetical protein
LQEYPFLPEEDTRMRISETQSATLMTLAKGAALGALIVMIGGQFYPGYMLDSNARTEATQARQSAIDSAASLMCSELYRSAPDSEANLVALRKGQGYSASNDALVVAAADKAMKLFANAKISPEPYKYGVQSGCGDQLYKSPPATAAQLK